MGWVVLVCGPSVRADAVIIAALFKALLRFGVVGRAKGLPVLHVPKECSIASVGDDVIPVAEFGAVAGGVETEALADHGGDHVLHLAPTCPARGRCGGLRTPGL